MLFNWMKFNVKWWVGFILIVTNFEGVVFIFLSVVLLVVIPKTQKVSLLYTFLLDDNNKFNSMNETKYNKN